MERLLRGWLDGVTQPVYITHAHVILMQQARPPDIRVRDRRGAFRRYIVAKMQRSPKDCFSRLWRDRNDSVLSLFPSRQAGRDGNLIINYAILWYIFWNSI